MKYFTLFALLISISSAFAANPFNYVMGSPLGPDKWHERPNTYCNGKRQSPINIVTADTVKPFFVELPIPFIGKVQPWKKVFFGEKPISANLTADYDKFTLKVEFDYKFRPYIKGGGAPGTYTFDSLHFHWARTETGIGSEHLINGQGYFGELHTIFRKKGSVTESIGDPVDGSGLLVFGFLLQKASAENTNLKPIFDGISAVSPIDFPTTGLKSQTTTITGLTLENIFKTVSDDSSHYGYDGSLTTPECQEAVVWRVFKNPIGISQTQMEALMGIQINVGGGITALLGNNARDVKNLEGRKVSSTEDGLIQELLIDLPVKVVQGIGSFKKELFTKTIDGIGSIFSGK